MKAVVNIRKTEQSANNQIFEGLIVKYNHVV